MLVFRDEQRTPSGEAPWERPAHSWFMGAYQNAS